MGLGNYGIRLNCYIHKEKKDMATQLNIHGVYKVSIEQRQLVTEGTPFYTLHITVSTDDKLPHEVVLFSDEPLTLEKDNVYTS